MALNRLLVLVVAFTIISSVANGSQTKRRSPQKRRPGATTFAEKQRAEIRVGRQQIAAQIKALTQFLYLLGSISKSIESAEQANRNHEESSVGMSVDRIEQNKARLRESIRNVRTALEQLESSFRVNGVLQAYYPNLSGVAKLAQTAESQSAANNFDQAARSLIAAVNKLTDALVALR